MKTAYRLACSTVGAMMVASTAHTAWAQSYPSRPVRIVVPFPAGGGVDIIARTLAQRMMGALGQTVLVDNRAGANGTIGADMVAKASPDGYTLLLASTGPLVIGPALPVPIPYDTARDFAPITQVVDNPMCLVIHPSLPAHSLKAFIALAKSRPGELNFASGGVGNALHLAGVIFNNIAGVRTVHVPYKGGAPAVTDLVSGQVHMMISSIPMMLPQIRAKRLRALALSAPERMDVLPEVPTMEEAGLRGFNANSWYGFVAPAGTPREVVDRLNAEAVRVLRASDVRTNFAQQGALSVGSTPDEFAVHIRRELVKWRGVVADAGIKR